MVVKSPSLFKVFYTSTYRDAWKQVKNGNRGKDGEMVVKIPSLSRYSTLPRIEKFGKQKAVETRDFMAITGHGSENSNCCNVSRGER